MVNDKIAVVRIGVVLKTGQIHAGMVFMVVLYRSGNTGIQQFNAAQISDIVMMTARWIGTKKKF